MYAAELDILGFGKYWDYDKQNVVPICVRSPISTAQRVQLPRQWAVIFILRRRLQRSEMKTASIHFGKATALAGADGLKQCPPHEGLLTVIRIALLEDCKEYEKFKDKLEYFM